MFALGWGLALQVYSTHVSAAPPRDDPSAVSVIELGLPGQAGAPSAYKVSLAEVLALADLAERVGKMGDAALHYRAAARWKAVAAE